MAKQTFTVGQVLTSAEMTALQLNDYNQSVSAKVASYTLVAADAGTRITMSNAGATTITVNTSLFTAGDTLFITNIGAGACTITAGTATVSTASSLVLAQYDSGRLYFTSTGVAIWEKYQGAASAGSPVGVGCTATSAVAQSIPNATQTALLFAAELFDTDGFHSTATNTSRMTIPAGKGGIYLVTGGASVSGTTGRLIMQIYKNGVSVSATENGNNSSLQGWQITRVLQLVATDYIELFVYQGSGGAQTLDPYAYSNQFSLALLGS